MQDNIQDKFEKLEGKIRGDYNKKIIGLNLLKRRWELLTGLDDTELRIFMKNPYFQYGRGNGEWPLTNFSENSEMKADPVFSKLSDLYEKIFEIDGFVNCGTEEDSPLQPIYRSLCGLATRMANRAMTEKEYTLLLKGKHPLFSIEQVQTLMKSTKVSVS